MNISRGKIVPAEDQMIPHPIELLRVQLVRLFFASNIPPGADTVEVDPKNVLIMYMPESLDSREKHFGVRVRAVYGYPGIDIPEDTTDFDAIPYSFLVEMLGSFRVNMEEMPLETIKRFQEKGASTVLAPFLREEVFALTMRAGYQPVIMPVTLVPIIRVSPDGKLAEEPKS